jgi:signal transduction histidine kinase
MDFFFAIATVLGVIAGLVLARGRLHGMVRDRAAKLTHERLAAYAHSLRQPIQAIELYASALERRVETVESKDFLARIHACVADAQARLTQLVKGDPEPSSDKRPTP